jgi:hypothetical protein
VGTQGFYVEDPDGYIIGFGGRPGRTLTTGCMSFASEKSCEDCPLWGAFIETTGCTCQYVPT